MPRARRQRRGPRARHPVPRLPESWLKVFSYVVLDDAALRCVPALPRWEKMYKKTEDYVSFIDCFLTNQLGVRGVYSSVVNCAATFGSHAIPELFCSGR